MNEMHESMKSQMREVEAEEHDNLSRIPSVATRKTSVSTACQTDKVFDFLKIIVFSIIIKLVFNFYFNFKFKF